MGLGGPNIVVVVFVSYNKLGSVFAIIQSGWVAQVLETDKHMRSGLGRTGQSEVCPFASQPTEFPNPTNYFCSQSVTQTGHFFPQ